MSSEACQADQATWRDLLTPDLVGRTVVVTGATSGIGRATAVGLARLGARLVLACRSSDRAAAVVDEIAAGPGAGHAEHIPLDLADLDSVTSCAQALVERGQPVHALVNNAGIAGQRGQTAQGFEITFGVNHLGHFLLTTLMLDGLGAHRPTRLVNLTSQAHHGAKGVDFAAVQQPTRTWTGVVEYQVAKLCNVLFTQELARRLDGTGVVAYAVHPGFVATNIWQRRVPWPYRSLYADGLLLMSPERGAAASLRCVTDSGLDHCSGAYFEAAEVCAPNPVATPELAAELWRRSEAWTAAWTQRTGIR